MVKSKEKRKIDYFLSYWGLLLLTIFLAFFFFHKNWFSSDSKPSIARIVETKGNVFFRSESFSGWDSAIPNQEIYGGDSVATGSDSGSVFSFSNKQNISIDQNTQIIFLSGPENQIKIELIKGFIEVRGLVDRKVEIVSGGENYIFEGEKNQCLRKNIDTNPKF
jgi:hypothetical protein